MQEARSRAMRMWPTSASPLAFSAPFAVRVEYRDAKQNLTVAPTCRRSLFPAARAATSSGGSRRSTAAPRSPDPSSPSVRRIVTTRPAKRFSAPTSASAIGRLRAAWVAAKWIRAGVTAEETKQENDQPGIDLDATTRQYSGDVEITPREGVVFRASLSRFRADNSILTRRPENFNVEPTLYAEDGRSREGGVALNFAPLSFDVSAARFTNSGANPFDVDRIRRPRWIRSSRKNENRTHRGVRKGRSRNLRELRRLRRHAIRTIRSISSRSS